MELTTELAKYGGFGVAIGSFILIAIILKYVFAFMKEVGMKIKDSLDKNNEVTSSLVIKLEKQNALDEERHLFMVNLNGKLTKAIEDRVKGR